VSEVATASCIESEWLTPAEAAQVLRVDKETLKYWRRVGHGPAYHSPSRRMVRYSRADVDAFMASTRVTPSRTA
jgi:excisionase family DNA binding protein